MARCPVIVVAGLCLLGACGAPERAAVLPVPPVVAAAPVAPAALAPAAPEPVVIAEGPAVVRALTEAELEGMRGVVWQAGCPVGLDALVLVDLRYRGPEGEVKRGPLVVHAEVAESVRAAFEELFELGFVLADVRPAEALGGDDARLMAENVTSAFNCRKSVNGGRFSTHASGRAVDVNPLWNPYVKGERVEPASGQAFVGREAGRVGTLVAGEPAVLAFTRRGLKWGGSWRSAKDYQHFSSTGD